MNLPIYKKILINFPGKKNIVNQLDQLDFGENPYIFEIGKSIKDHTSSLKVIDGYFEEHNINTHSYPVFIISHSKALTSRIKILDSNDKIPSHFDQKKKQLSNKESGKLELIKLKQKQLETLQRNDFVPTLNSFAKGAKIIAELEKENLFYLNIIKKLKDEHVTK